MNFIKYIISIIFLSFMLSNLMLAQMAGYTIGVDAGHGDTDPGALGINGSTTPDESDIVLTVSLELQKKFQNLGASVVMTRTTDVFHSLSYRRNLMNQQNPDAYVSVHENSFTSSSANGTETFVHTNSGNNSSNLATIVQAKMIADMGFTDRGVKRASFTAISVNASIPAALTEGCFLSNTTEWNYITQFSNQVCHANAIKNGILEYLGLNNLVDLNCTTVNPPTNTGNLAPLGSIWDFTSQSSTFFGAQNIIDGTTSTRWNTDGANSFNYVIVELDQVYAINRFVLKNASTGGLSVNLNTQEYRILYWTGAAWSLSVDGNNVSKLGTISHNVSTVNAKWVAIVIDDPTFTSDNFGRITEFEVYGNPVNPRLSNANKTPDMLSFTKDVLQSKSVSAHPNMVTNGSVQFIIDHADDEPVTIILNNALGQVVRKITNTKGNTSVQVDVKNLQAGVYFYNLQTENNQASVVKKLIIQ